jgi:hypothetical protein
VKRLLSVISAHVLLGTDELKAIRAYLSGNEFRDDEGYRCMVANLPGPPDGESLADRFPVLVPEWNLDRNAPLVPSMFHPFSSRKIWWLCPLGHSWKATILSRTNAGTGCPECSNRKVGAGNNLAARRPEIAAEWHPDRNGDLTPSDVLPGSDHKVWWLCPVGHAYAMRVHKRTGPRQGGCPFCSGRVLTPERSLAAASPKAATQWHPTLNGDLTPADVGAGSHRKAHWLCPQGHAFEMPVYKRVGSRVDGCPFCSGRRLTLERSLATRRPDLALQWAPDLNEGLTPADVSAGTQRKVWWRCARRHEWQATVASRVAGNGCRQCSLLPEPGGSLVARHSDYDELASGL